MNRNRWIGLLLAGVLLVVALSVWQSGSQAFETEFVEIATYRNPNNTGPVKRWYVVAVSTANWEEMLAYAGRMPHSKYGTTTVYFFLAGAPMPDFIGPKPPHFPEEFAPNVLATYQKQAMGQESFERME